MTVTPPEPEARPCTTRREFLLTAGSATAIMLLTPDLVRATSATDRRKDNPRREADKDCSECPCSAREPGASGCDSMLNGVSEAVGGCVY